LLANYSKSEPHYALSDARRSRGERPRSHTSAVQDVGLLRRGGSAPLKPVSTIVGADGWATTPQHTGAPVSAPDGTCLVEGNGSSLQQTLIDGGLNAALGDALEACHGHTPVAARSRWP
jgi:hypothetical protein